MNKLVLGLVIIAAFVVGTITTGNMAYAPGHGDGPATDLIPPPAILRQLTSVNSLLDAANVRFEPPSSPIDPPNSDQLRALLDEISTSLVEIDEKHAAWIEALR